MRSFLIVSAALTAIASAGPLEAQQTSTDSIWRNPQNSVHVRVHDCGSSRCGTVVWANEKAKADSARGGTPNLIGTQLFKDFREVSAKVWKGKVFVPDIGRTFSGTGTVKDSNTIVARGCLTGNFGCKSQTWTRVTAPAR